jgi:hypothetical protein
MATTTFDAVWAQSRNNPPILVIATPRSSTRSLARALNLERERDIMHPEKNGLVYWRKAPEVLDGSKPWTKHYAYTRHPALAIHSLRGLCKGNAWGFNESLRLFYPSRNEYVDQSDALSRNADPIVNAGRFWIVLYEWLLLELDLPLLRLEDCPFHDPDEERPKWEVASPLTELAPLMGADWANRLLVLAYAMGYR